MQLCHHTCLTHLCHHTCLTHLCHHTCLTHLPTHPCLHCLAPLCSYAYTLSGHEHAANDDLDSAMTCYRNALRFDGRHYNAQYVLPRHASCMAKLEPQCWRGCTPAWQALQQLDGKSRRLHALLWLARPLT